MKKRNTVTRKEFAEMNGWSPSYVTKLAHAGRIVLTKHEKPTKQRVLVKETLTLIKKTKDPNRDDVVSRHKKNRIKKQAPHTKKKSEKKTKPTAKNRVDQSYVQSRAEKEYYLAQKAKVEHLKMVGELCETARARYAAGEVGTIIRAALENQPDQLAPMLAAESDENRCHALMVEYNEQLLNDLAARMTAAVEKMVASVE